MNGDYGWFQIDLTRTAGPVNIPPMAVAPLPPVVRCPGIRVLGPKLPSPGEWKWIEYCPECGQLKEDD